MANDDTASTPVNTSVKILVLANDTDPQKRSLQVAWVQSSTSPGGTITISSDRQSVTYKPPANFSGQDTFGYQAQAVGGTVNASATVTVNVGGSALVASGPVTAKANGQVIQGLDITATGTQAGVQSTAFPTSSSVTAAFAIRPARASMPITRRV